MNYVILHVQNVTLLVLIVKFVIQVITFIYKVVSVNAHKGIISINFNVLNVNTHVKLVLLLRTIVKVALDYFYCKINALERHNVVIYDMVNHFINNFF